MNRAAAAVESGAGQGNCDPIDLALDYLSQTQAENGCWQGDYSGPLFLIPSLVATKYILGQTWRGEQREAIVKYLAHHQNDDGGWGLYVEDSSRLYTTVLNYVALRLLDQPASDTRMVRARNWMHDQGGAVYVPLWGKFLLAVLNLYDFRGVMPTPPEMWSLPKWLPFHPARMWCHSRMVLLPMTYLYGKRAQAPLNERLIDIRQEIYTTTYEKVDFASSMYKVAASDTYRPYSRTLRSVGRVLQITERLTPGWIRRRCQQRVLKHIDQEDQNTNYICLGPINKLLNALCWHFEQPGSQRVEKHVARLDDYLSQDATGLRMNGYNSSQLWDTAFATQAICASERAAAHTEVLAKAADFIDQQQVLEDVPKQFDRHRSRGGWPFSDADHGWPISDCTALGLEATLNLSEILGKDRLSQSRMTSAVELILSLQNRDGGWATYERTRGPRWLEKLNATSLFADVMIDYSYVECTSACLQGLARFRQHYPNVLVESIQRAIHRGCSFLREQQREDGSWVGSWGVCFTYGTWFGIWGLRAAGVDSNDNAVNAAAEFLLKQQLDDGGWGESMQSCRDETYTSTDHGQAVMTSWAVLALLRTTHGASPEVARAIEFLKNRQRADGSWPPEHIAGVFNKSCAIHYDNYLKVFPLWALAEANRRHAQEEQ